MNTNGPFAIRRAARADCDEAGDLLREAARFMRGYGEALWGDEELTPAAVARLVAANELVLALSGARIAACMALQSRDLAFWPDFDDGRAFYIGKLAIRRAVAGSGAVDALLAWAAEEAKRCSKLSLRLYCPPDPDLCARCEALGFIKIDEVRTARGRFGPAGENEQRVVRYHRVL